jgi:acyl carrier protein
MKELTEANVRQFLLDEYREPIGALGLVSESFTDDFDFLLTGVIDSHGLIEMIGAIENEFQIEVNLAALDAEEITVLGPLCRYVARQGTISLPAPQ